MISGFPYVRTSVLPSVRTSVRPTFGVRQFNGERLSRFITFLDGTFVHTGGTLLSKLGLLR